MNRFITADYVGTETGGAMKSRASWGKANGSYKHGLSDTVEYSIWQDMKKRCSHHVDYAGRGISVCKSWDRSFLRFLKDMGNRPTKSHTIERIDNDGNYCKRNCRWATRKEQIRNTRRTRRIKCDGVFKTIGEWSEITGVPYGAIEQRLRIGWGTKSAIYTKTDAKTNGWKNRDRGEKLTINGETKTLVEWAKHPKARGISAIRKRLRCGWDHKNAVFAPSRQGVAYE